MPEDADEPLEDIAEEMKVGLASLQQEGDDGLVKTAREAVMPSPIIQFGGVAAEEDVAPNLEETTLALRGVEGGAEHVEGLSAEAAREDVPVPASAESQIVDDLENAAVSGEQTAEPSTAAEGHEGISEEPLTGVTEPPAMVSTNADDGLEPVEEAEADDTFYEGASLLNGIQTTKTLAPAETTVVMAPSATRTTATPIKTTTDANKNAREVTQEERWAKKSKRAKKRARSVTSKKKQRATQQGALDGGAAVVAA